MSTMMRQSLKGSRKIIRQTYSHKVSEIMDINKQKLNMQKIIAINFGQDALIIVGKKKLCIYSILTLKIFYVRQGFFWDASFIPNSALVALVQHDGTFKSRKTFKILDLQKNQFIASMTVNFQIQQIKATLNCICLVGLKEIGVVHFPSLKPICHQFAGSGLKVAFDISYQGLTLAYQNQKKGFVNIHNFSSVQTSKARRKSQQNNMLRNKSVLNSFVGNSQNPKKMVQIKAHNENINIIRLSPNGSRLATTSQKGTMIRIFLTQNGRLWQQLRVQYQLCKILDISFYEQGNFITCINEKSMINLYNLKLQVQEEQAEEQKRGYKIYQQQNPKSIFSFLSIIYNNFGNQYPFAFFQLTRPKQEQQQINQLKIMKNQSIANKPQSYELPNLKNLKSSSSIEKDRQIPSQQKSMAVIVQDHSENQDRGQYKQQKMSSINLMQSKRQKNREKQHNQKSQRSPSLYSQKSSKRTKSILKKFNINQSKKENYDYVGKVYNTVAKIFIGGDNFIWAIKGSYIFTLKYDPFNGGQMYFKEAIKFC